MSVLHRHSQYSQKGWGWWGPLGPFGPTPAQAGCPGPYPGGYWGPPRRRLHSPCRCSVTPEQYRASWWWCKPSRVPVYAQCPLSCHCTPLRRSYWDHSAWQHDPLTELPCPPFLCYRWKAVLYHSLSYYAEYAFLQQRERCTIKENRRAANK